MTRTNFEEHDINEALFDVKLKPVFIKDGKDGETQLNSHFAVYDSERKKVLSVVTKNYHLITNKEALEKGKQIFHKVFSLIKMEDMQCFNITMPRTRSFCHIDLIHKNSDFDVWKNDTWTPFLRVTNSYNRTKLLKYEIGFCRWICKNGMIFGSKSIEFSSTHSKSERESVTRFIENIGDIKAMEARFVEGLIQLKRYHVPKKLMFPLLLKVFDIKSPETGKGAKAFERLNKIKLHTENLVNSYFHDLGENAYSALNVLTDFASRPEAVISPANQINKLQAQSANWMEDFIRQIEQRSFNFEDYLKNQIKQEAELTKVMA